ncbi:MAG: hypothetical protein K5829_05380 [Treponema sp.]|nr:hypothetical protein [Treponema sp.]
MNILNKKILFLIPILISSFILDACSEKKELVLENKEELLEVQPVNHSWYYFTENDFVQTDKPQNAPFVVKRAWTEAVRISSASCLGGSDFVNKGFAVVNRLGVLCFENDRVELCVDSFLFKDRSAGNLGFWNDTPIFSVYKSSFFNDTVLSPDYKKDNSLHFFLVQFDENAKISYPLVNSNNLVEDLNSEVTDFIWNGNEWICSVKTIDGSRNSFSYVKWKPMVPLLSITPATASKDISKENVSVDEFRNSKSILDYSYAPERVKKMLTGFSDKKSFYLDVKSAGGNSERKYYNQSAESGLDLYAKAIIDQSWSCVLFEDGTLFVEGALPGKHILRNGKAVAVRLPKLPAGFLYSDFLISGTTLYAAWEESSFYEVARSGFIKIDLDKTLYSRLI